MWLAAFLAIGTSVATGLGGYLALRTRDRLHLALGLSAGLLLGLVGFDLLPTIYRANHQQFGGLRVVSLLLIGGFLVLHVLERATATHEPHESDYHDDHDHYHPSRAGVVGALAMIGHVFLDGAGIGASFRVSTSLGIAVTSALAVHAFSDGLNTVSLLVHNQSWRERSGLLLGADVVARLSGAVLGSALCVTPSAIALYLALFSGFVVYIATSHILPEAHARHPSRATLLATVFGVVVMALVVAGGA
jgi:ZIP family zinc transporter